MLVLFLAGGLALWSLAAIFVLSVCRAASRADENDAGRRLIRASRRGVSVSVAAATVVAGGAPDSASAEECADRHVRFAEAPSLMREAVLCEIARVRARHDARRLRGDPALDLAATRHAVDMVERRYFAHVSPGGGDVVDRVQRAGYSLRRCTWRLGEVLARRFGPGATAADTVRAWMASPEHRRILVSQHYRELGIGLQAGTPSGAHPSGVTVAAVLGHREC